MGGGLSQERGCVYSAMETETPVELHGGVR